MFGRWTLQALAALASQPQAVPAAQPPPPATAVPATRPARPVLTPTWLPQDQRAPVAFENPTGHILFRMSVGGREVWAMLDNGADRTIVDLALARAMGLRMRDEAVMVGSGRSRVPAQLVSDVALAVPGQFQLTAPMLWAVDLTAVSAPFGRRIEAVIGGDLIDHVTLQLDPARRLFSFRPSGSFMPPEGARHIPLHDGRPYLDVTTPRGTARVAIDLGSNGVLTLAPEAFARIAPEGIETRTGVGSGADARLTPVLRARLPAAAIGPATLNNLPVAIRSMAARDRDGMIGMGFLGRFNFVLDTAQGKLWLQRASGDQANGSAAVPPGD